MGHRRSQPLGANNSIVRTYEPPSGYARMTDRQKHTAIERAIEQAEQWQAQYEEFKSQPRFLHLPPHVGLQNGYTDTTRE